MSNENFFEKVGKIIGWDFSMLKVISEGEKWDFYELVASKLKNTDIWLDLASGSGEKFIRFADKCFLLVGSDLTDSMIVKSSENVKNSSYTNIRFTKIDSTTRIDFPDCFFDVISVRHGSYNPFEVSRILKAGGIFLSQNVEFKDKENLFKYFGRHQMMDTKGLIADKYASEFKELGFADVFVDEYNADEYYQTEEDMLFLLKHTPIVPNFGEEEQDIDKFERYLKDNKTEKGIKTNSHRSLIIATK